MESFSTHHSVSNAEAILFKADNMSIDWKDKEVEALREEEFRMIFVHFRPTAENFAKYFYDRVKENGYDVKLVKVYETPNNMAAYGE